MEFLAVGLHLDHGPALDLLDLVLQLAILGVAHFVLPHDDGQLLAELDHLFALEPGEERAQHAEGHASQGDGLLVAVNAAVQVGLGERAEPEPLVDVDEHGRLDAVSDGEGDLLEDRPPPGVLPGERLQDGGQLGVEEAEQGADEDLGHTAAAGGAQHARVGDGAVVEGLHVMDLGVLDERADQAVDEPRMDVLDVGIDVDDDVALQEIEGLPEVFALAALGAFFGEMLGGDVDVGTETGGDLARAVGAAGIDDGDLVQQRIAVFELRLEDHDFLPDGFLFVQGGQAERDGQSLALLLFHQPLDVPEVGVMEGPLFEPFLRLHRRPPCRWQELRPPIGPRR